MKLETFDFNNTPVRVLVREEAPWFVAVDVCRVLEISNSRDAVRELDEDEKGVASASATVGNSDIKIPNRGLQIVSESGLYALIFKSRKAEAKKFRKWVTSVVLPTIRQTGRFEAAGVVSVGNEPMQLMSVIDYVNQKCVGVAPGCLHWDEVLDLARAVRRAEVALGMTGGTRKEPDGGRVRTFSPMLLSTLWQLQLAPRLTMRQRALEAKKPEMAA